MSDLLPILPERGQPIAREQVEAIERAVIANLPAIKDIAAAEEWLARAAALERYLSKRGLKEPMLGAERRIEARIGQLLGPPRRDHDRRRGAKSVVTDIARMDRHDFRVLRHALDGTVTLGDKEWRKGRQRVVTLIKQRLPAEDGGYATASLPETDDLTIRAGDFRQALDDLAPGSVDLIFTDPPYAAASVPLYADLGAIAARVLRPGGSLVAYCGHHALPDILPALDLHLRYWWMLASYHGVGHHNSLAGKRVYVGWKPLVWYVQERNGAPGFVHDTTARVTPDKQRHDWSQSLAEAELWIDQLCPPDGLVLDPFAGAGTTLQAARRQGRRAIGVELDDQRAQVAAGRLIE